MNDDNIVEIWGVSPGDVSLMVQELKQQGLIVHEDFDFEFRPSWVNYQDGTGAHQRSVRLRFRDAAMATWVGLKYSEDLTSRKVSS